MAVIFSIKLGGLYIIIEIVHMHFLSLIFNYPQNIKNMRPAENALQKLERKNLAYFLAHIIVSPVLIFYIVDTCMLHTRPQKVYYALK